MSYLFHHIGLIFDHLYATPSFSTVYNRVLHWLESPLTVRVLLSKEFSSFLSSWLLAQHSLKGFLKYVNSCKLVFHLIIKVKYGVCNKTIKRNQTLPVVWWLSSTNVLHWNDYFFSCNLTVFSINTQQSFQNWYFMKRIEWSIQYQYEKTPDSLSFYVCEQYFLKGIWI